MNVLERLKLLNDWGPLLFGIGFLGPLIAQTLDALALPLPFGVPSIACGLLVGVSAGLAAKARGSWV